MELKFRELYLISVKGETDLGLNVALINQITDLAFAYLSIHSIIWRMVSILGRKCWEINKFKRTSGGRVGETATIVS